MCACGLRMDGPVPEQPRGGRGTASDAGPGSGGPAEPPGARKGYAPRKGGWSVTGVTGGREDANLSFSTTIPGAGPTDEAGDSDVKRLQEELLHAALHDGLTGLANRRLCLDRLRGALHQRARAPRPA